MSAITFKFREGIKLMTKMLFLPYNYHMGDCKTYTSVKFLQKCHILAKSMSVNS